MCGCPKHHDETAECTCICEEHRNFEAARELAMSRYDLLKECVEARQELQAVALSAIRGLMLSDNLGDVHEEIDRLRAAVDLPELEGDYLSGWEAVDWEGTGSDE